MATQNLRQTEFAIGLVVIACYDTRFFIKLIRLTTISFPFVIMYSTPFNVETITLIKARIACYKDGCSTSMISLRNEFLLFVLNRKMSLRISSYTKFFLSSGEIYSAFTLKLSKTSTRPLMSPWDFAWINFFLCSCITVSENKADLSQSPSEIRTWSYLSSCTL